MVRAEVRRWRLLTSCSIEHLTQRRAVYDAAVHAKTHDAPRPLVRQDEDPVRVEDGRFASKQIKTPQAVLRVTKDREPGRPRRVRCRLVPSRENASHHILVDGNPEGQSDLLRDPWTSPARVPLFHVDDGGHDFLAGPLGPGFIGRLDEKSQRYFR